MAEAEDAKAEDVAAAAVEDESKPVPPSLLRLKSTEKASDAFSSEMRSLWSKYHEHIGEEATQAATTSAAASSTSEEDFAKKAAELKEQARDKLKAALKEDGTLQSLFKKYDANEDGVLSKEEVLSLMKDYLSANAEWAPETVKSTVTVSCDVTGEALAAQMGDSSEMSEEEKGQIAEALALQKKMMDAMLEPMIKAAQTVAAAMLEDVETFANDFFDALDKDGNGKVDKTEFMNGFVDEMAAVFDPEKTIKYQMLAMGDMMGGMFAGLAAAAGAEEDQDCLIM